jgi:hypothetical protein
MPRNSSIIYLTTITGLLAGFAVLAILFGYISVDSWYYMLLAQALRHGQGCSLHGEYSAVYPCGYPALLALTAPVATPAVMMISSKIANLILLAASFWFVLKASRHVFMAALVVLNPVTLIIGMYTWSENLMLFCVCGTIYALSQIHADDRKWLPCVLLTGFLILGCSARYIFGPFAFLLFLCAWPAFGLRTALRAFPSFCVAGLVFIAWQVFNHEVTGFATGMPRVPAPEAPLLLVRQFLIALGINGLGVLVAGLLLTGISIRQLSRVRGGESTRSAALFVTLAGLSFLALAFILRLRTQFDPYNTRTIGYGVVLTIAGLVGLFVHIRKQDGMARPVVLWPVLAMCAAAVFSVAYADNGALIQSISDSFDDFQFPATSLANLKSAGPPADVVVWFQLPVPGLDSANVDNIGEIYYGRNVTLLTPTQGENGLPETPAALLHQLDGLADKRCYFDFTPFATLADFQTYLSSGTLIDRRWVKLNEPWQEIDSPNLEQHMQSYLARIFQPGRLVPCRAILDRPESRQAFTLTHTG